MTFNDLDDYDNYRLIDRRFIISITCLFHYHNDSQVLHRFVFGPILRYILADRQWFGTALVFVGLTLDSFYGKNSQKSEPNK